MIDVRFATAFQMMLTLANAERLGQPLVTSTQLARGIASTPSLVRRLLAELGAAGVVRSSLGKGGGVRLARPASEIRIGEIYRAVVGDKTLLAGRRDVPHLCDVSSRVEQYFENLATDVDEAVVRMLDGRTLERSLDEMLAEKRRPRRTPSRVRSLAGAERPNPTR